MDIHGYWTWIATVMVIIVICKSSSQEVTFLIYKKMSLENGVCRQDVEIDGNGINDSIAMSCNDARSMVTAFIPNGFLIGDFRRHQISLFTENTKSLITILGDNKECRRKIYNQFKQTSAVLPQKECNGVKEKIKRCLTEKSQDKNTQLKGSNGINVIKSESRNYGAPCIGSIQVVGHGIDDRAVVDCAFVAKMEVLFIQGGVIVGDWRKTGEAVFTDTPNTLVVIRRGVNTCDKKIFSGNPPPRTERMDQQACAAVKRAVDHYWDHKGSVSGENVPSAEFSIRKTRYEMISGLLTQYIEIEGNGIKDQLSIPFSVFRNMELVEFPVGFVFADWKTNRKFIFSNTRNVMIVLDLSARACFFREYRKKKLVRRIQIDCNVYFEKIETIWKTWYDKTKNNGITVHRHNYVKNGQCIQDIFVEGHGVKDTLTVSCDAGRTMTTVFTATGFVLGEYIMDQTSAFSDSQGSWVILQSGGRVCSSRTVTGGRTQTEQLSEEMCKEVKVKIQSALARHMDGYLVPGQKRNIEFIIDIETLQKKGDCEQNIKITGNGIDDVITVPCDIANKLGILFLHNGFVMGDYRTEPMSVLTDSPEAVVVIREGGQKCTRTTYEDGKKLQESMGSKQCEAAKEVVQGYWSSKDKLKFWVPE